jgi:hypothetical protein
MGVRVGTLRRRKNTPVRNRIVILNSGDLPWRLDTKISRNLQERSAMSMTRNMDTTTIKATENSLVRWDSPTKLPKTTLSSPNSLKNLKKRGNHPTLHQAPNPLAARIDP